MMRHALFMGDTVWRTEGEEWVGEDRVQEAPCPPDNILMTPKSIR